MGDHSQLAFFLVGEELGAGNRHDPVGLKHNPHVSSANPEAMWVHIAPGSLCGTWNYVETCVMQDYAIARKRRCLGLW